LKLIRLTRVARIRGVGVDVHWSVLLIGTIILLGVFKDPLLSMVGGVSYLSVLLLHECGHLVAAQRKGCRVFAIELYPVCGFTRFEAPWSRVDRAVIAWGGVLAQAAIGIPIVAFLVLFGYTRWEPVNAVLALLGFFSLAVAFVNLLPIPPLDGAQAWDLFPALLQASRERRRARAARR